MVFNGSGSYRSRSFLGAVLKGQHARARPGEAGKLWEETSPVVTMPVFELVKTDFAAERVAMDPEHTCRARLIALRAVQHSLDEFLLKFGNRLVEEDSAFDHLSDERFQLVFHDCTLHSEARNSQARPRHSSSWPMRLR